MRYLKTTEIADKYNVNRRTVVRWIELARDGKVNFELTTIGKRDYILDTPTNIVLIKKMALENKKFTNTTYKQKVSPTDKFYEIFNEDQIIDIVNNIKIHHEIPHKYAYFDGSASFWDTYVKNGFEKSVQQTIDIINFQKDYLYSILKKYDQINLVDIGPGNGAPVKDLLNFLIEKKLLRKYIAIDYSPEILNITEKNLKEWISKDLPFEGHIKDITTDNFQELLFRNTHLTGTDNGKCANLLIFVGSTIENQLQYDQSLLTIRQSMGENDFFILGQSVLENDRNHSINLGFSASSTSKKNADLEQELVTLDLLNIDEDHFEVERKYDDNTKSKTIAIKMLIDLEIEIQTKTFKETLKLSKNDRIVIYRHNYHTSKEVINRLSKIGFKFIQGTSSIEGDQLIVLSKLKVY